MVNKHYYDRGQHIKRRKRYGFDHTVFYCSLWRPYGKTLMYKKSRKPLQINARDASSHCQSLPDNLGMIHTRIKMYPPQFTISGTDNLEIKKHPILDPYN